MRAYARIAHLFVRLRRGWFTRSRSARLRLS
jgi:hypothetical protein